MTPYQRGQPFQPSRRTLSKRAQPVWHQADLPVAGQGRRSLELGPDQGKQPKWQRNAIEMKGL